MTESSDADRAKRPKLGRVAGLSRDGSSNRVLGQQLAHAVGELRTLADPMLNTLALQIDGGRVGARIVGTYNLQRTAIAGQPLLNHHYPVVRLLSGAEARKTNHQHNRNPLRTWNWNIWETGTAAELTAGIPAFKYAGFAGFGQVWMKQLARVFIARV